MAIQFHCPSCRQPIEVDGEYALKEVACPYCRKVVTAPAASTLVSPPPQARAVGEPLTGQVGPVAGRAPAPYPPRVSRLSLVGFSLAVGSLLIILLGGMAMRSVVEEYAQKKKLQLQDAVPALQQELMNGKAPPNVGFLFLGASMACVGFLANVGGLVCSLIALFQPTGRKSWAIAGTVVGFILPLQMLLIMFGYGR
jgi:hypothetical protein